MWMVANEMPIRFSVVKRILSEVVKRFPTLEPHSVLDFGCNTGENAWSISSVWPHQLRYTGVEPSLNMARIAQHFSAGITSLDMKFTPRLRGTQHGRHSVTLAAYSLGSLPPGQWRKTLDELWACTEDVLILVEKGDIAGFDCIRIAREYMLKKYCGTSIGFEHPDVASVLAPCTHTLACPMGSKSHVKGTKGISKSFKICSFGQKVPRSRLPIKSPLHHIKTKAINHLGDNLVQDFWHNPKL